MRVLWKIIRYGLLVLALGALLVVARSSGTWFRAGPETAARDDLSESEPGPEQTPAPLTLAVRADHPALMVQPADGSYRPDDPLTTEDVVRAASVLTEGLVQPASAMWLDGEGTQGLYRDAAALTQAGVLQGPFRPEQAVTRQELAGMLHRLAQLLSGQSKADVLALSGAVVRGEVLEGQQTAPGQPVTRREGAVVLERLAGREPDQEALFNAGLKPIDMEKDDGTWAYMADAALEGDIPERSPGLFRQYGWLYKADENGALVTDQTDGVWYFGPDGRYTTQDAELDQELLAAVMASGADVLSGQEALAAVYLYVKNNFDYKLTPQDQTPEAVGSTGWEYARASRFFRYGGGTCYGYAATFGLLARILGENAQIVAAEVNQFYGDHAFVVIPADGVDWIYDPELEDTRPERHADLELFHMENHVIYDYWYTPGW